MKAFVLAAGLGTRLRPLTDSTPKCLITVGGRSLLDIWLDALARIGVDEVLVNTHHLSEDVAAHVAVRSDLPPRVRLVHEHVLLGSAGTLRANEEFVRSEDMFLAINADNLTDVDLQHLVDAHSRGATLATIAVFESDRPSECGVVEVQDGVVVGFEEKPTAPRSNLANAGIYAFHPDVIELVSGPYPLDIGYHLLPRLVGAAKAWPLGHAYLADIGTPAALERARREWEGIEQP